VGGVSIPLDVSSSRDSMRSPLISSCRWSTTEIDFVGVDMPDFFVDANLAILVEGDADRDVGAESDCANFFCAKFCAFSRSRAATTNH
jgi:hypothetical protein